MKINEIIDKLHEADFYIYEDEATSIKFNHNFLNGCNLAISLDGEINLTDDSTYNMKLARYNSNWEGAKDSGEYYSKEVGVVNVIVFPPTITDLTMRICLLHYLTKRMYIMQSSRKKIVRNC